MLPEVKTALRIFNTAFDSEIEGLIAAARQDLKVSSVSSVKADATTDIDPLIKRAIITYCKAHFGYDNPDADRFAQSYESLKIHLTLAGDYNGSVV